MNQPVPYMSATSGEAARGQIVKLLQRFGCSSVGFMDDFVAKTLVLVFDWRGRRVQLKASATGWAGLYLREHPWNTRRRCDEQAWKDRALKQGMIAINSVLRDWAKAQVTAVETGLLQFDHVFFPYLITESGATVAEKYIDKVPLIEADMKAEVHT